MNCRCAGRGSQPTRGDQSVSLRAKNGSKKGRGKKNIELVARNQNAYVSIYSLVEAKRVRLCFGEGGRCLLCIVASLRSGGSKPCFLFVRAGLRRTSYAYFYTREYPPVYVLRNMRPEHEHTVLRSPRCLRPLPRGVLNSRQLLSPSNDMVFQARSCEFSQLLRPELGELRKGMLDRMPVADEETVRNRRARFRNDDVSIFFFVMDRTRGA